MRKVTVLSIVFLAILVPLLYAAPAQAQATRTWVSGVGDDANPCSRTAPCKTFAGAISKTAAGGEISALDPGGFGAVTITKSITINGDGTLAGILASLTNGVIINAAAADDIVLRNISINGAGNGLNGIRFLAGGSLTIQNVNIYAFTQNCLDIAFTANSAVTHVTNSNFSDCAAGVRVFNSAAGVRSSLNMNNSKISDVTTGINAERQANVALDNVTITGAGTGVVVSTVGAPASEANIAHGLIGMNALGVQINSGSTARLSDILFSANTKAMDNQGSCQTTGDNILAGNVNANTGGACSAVGTF